MVENTDFHENVKIKVIPRSQKSEIIGKMDDGSLKIKLKSAPEDGKANRELLEILQKNFGGEWKIISGQTSTRKIVKKL